MPSNTITRRRLLTVCSVIASATLGGCIQSSPMGSNSSSRPLALLLTPLDGTLRDRYVQDLSDTRPSWDEDAFNAALNGTPYTTQHHPPFLARGENPMYAEWNGTYYHLDSLVVGEASVTRPVLRLYEVDPSENGHSQDPIPHASLPTVDKQGVQAAWFAARARGNPGGVPWELVERDGYVYRDDDAIAQSELLDEAGPTHVSHRDGVYRVEIAEEVFHEEVYQPDIDPVAVDPDEMETVLRASLLDARIEREALSRAAREVIDQAIGETYSEPHPYSEGFQLVLKHLERWAYLDGNVEKDGNVGAELRTGYLDYDDRYYEFLLRFVTEV